jgi:pimeloyl-ACP methyl ester carboxylesterase
MTRIKTVVDLQSNVTPISYFDRAGGSTPILFLHGLGNAASNFDALLANRSLAQHRLVALDFPGCGTSPYPSNQHQTIDDLVDLVDGFVARLQLPKFLLVGASMGGLVGLLYAERRPDQLVGFVCVEGNLAPEDCMFSRLVVPHTYEHFRDIIFPQIKASLRTTGEVGAAEHLKVLETANPRAYYDYSFQTVDYSDNGELLNRFLTLPVTKHFVYGSRNRHLSYLPVLRDSSCRLTEIENAGHFLFYDAPDAFAECVGMAAHK